MVEDTDACMHVHECFCFFADVNKALSTGEIMHHSFILSCIKLNIIHRIGHATESPQCWRVHSPEKQIVHKQVRLDHTALKWDLDCFFYENN